MKVRFQEVVRVSSGMTFDYVGGEDDWQFFNQDPRFWGDIDGDGRADIVAFKRGPGGFLGIGGDTGRADILVGLSNLDGDFSDDNDGSISDIAKLQGRVFHGRIYNHVPRDLGDVDGDGLEDIVRFGGPGERNTVDVLKSNGDGTFTSIEAFDGFTRYQSSSKFATQAEGPRLVGDINGDGRADIVAVGRGSKDNFQVALGQADATFGERLAQSIDIRNSGFEFKNQNDTPIQLADLNGDGKQDIVKLSGQIVQVAFGTDSGVFSDLATNVVLNPGATSSDEPNFGSQSDYVRSFGDMDGDGKDDLVAISSAGVYIAQSKGDGSFERFQKFNLVSEGLFLDRDDASDERDTEWLKIDLSDVNGDGRMDLVGFGANGAYVSVNESTNTAPISHDDNITFEYNGSNLLERSVFLDNGFGADVDWDGDEIRLVEFTIDESVYSAGEVAILDSGSSVSISDTGNLTVSPLPENYSGDEFQFSYTISDGEETSTSSVNVMVNVEPEQETNVIFTSGEVVEVLRGTSSSDVFVFGEHAGNSERNSHIIRDFGADDIVLIQGGFVSENLSGQRYGVSLNLSEDGDALFILNPDINVENLILLEEPLM